MEKTLRYLALAGVLGCAAIIAAQQLRGGGTASLRQSGGASADRLASIAMQHDSISVLQALQRYFWSHQDLEIERAKLAGHPERVNLVIQASCAATLTTLTPQQQKKEVQQVWQLDKWRPNDTEWRAVSKSPSMVDRLLHIDSASLAKVDSNWNGIVARFMQPLQDVGAKLSRTPGWATADQQTRNNMLYKANQEIIGKKSLIQRIEEHVQRTEANLNFAYSLLKPDEKAEFDAIKNRFDRQLLAAAGGKTPAN